MGSKVNGSMKLISWTIGIVVFLITIYSVFHVPLVKAIADEAEARQAGDTTISEKIGTKIEKLQSDITDIKIMIVKLVK